MQHLYISPDHNFFGHHEKPPGENPIIEVEEIVCVAGLGIQGDRFFNYKPDYKGQITFFSAEVFQELCTHLNLKEKTPAALRRNVILSGIDLNTLIGQTFILQNIQFLGTEECRPCYWMDQALGAGAENFLKGRGGLRAKILSNGLLRKER